MLLVKLMMRHVLIRVQEKPLHLSEAHFAKVAMRNAQGMRFMHRVGQLKTG